MKTIFKQINQGLAAVILLACAVHLHAEIQAAGATPTPVVQTEQAASSSGSQQLNIESKKSPDTIAAGPVNNKPNTAGQLTNLLGGLVLILILIFGLSWFVKRFSQGGFMQNPVFKVVASMPLGTRERLMLVSVGDKQILLGVTATQISNLHVFDEPVVLGDKEPASDFSQKLMAILQQKNISQSGNSSPRDRQA